MYHTLDINYYWRAIFSFRGKTLNLDQSSVWVDRSAKMLHNWYEFISVPSKKKLRNCYVNIAQRVTHLCGIPKHSRYIKRAASFTQQLRTMKHSCVMSSLRNGYTPSYAIQYVSVLCLHYVIVAWQVTQQLNYATHCATSYVSSYISSICIIVFIYMTGKMLSYL